MFLDPTDTVSVDLPPGWAFDPLSSSLTDLVFTDWYSPEHRQLFVHVVRTKTELGAGDDEWEADVREDLPAEATRVERRAGPTLLVERPGREGRADQRWAIVRGPRLDTIIEQVGVPLGGALATPELAVALRSLSVPANQYVAEQQKQSEWKAAMASAGEADQAGDSLAAGQLLSRARTIAKNTWLHSLVGRAIPEIPAAMAMAESILGLADVTGSALFLQQATLTLYRAQRSLHGLPVRSAPVLQQRLEALLTLAFQLHGNADKGQVPQNPVTACMARARLLVLEHRQHLDSGSRKIGVPWASFAVEDAMTAVSYARRRLIRHLSDDQASRLAKRGITDKTAQIETVNALFEITALQQLVAAGAVLSAAQAYTATDADRAGSANWLLAGRRLAELSPSPDHEEGKVLALNGYAAALAALGDEGSLAEAKKHIAEAHGILDRLGNEGELRAQICLAEAWIMHYSHESEGAVTLLDRGIAAAERDHSVRMERAARSLRSQFLALEGRHDEAVAEARRAVGGADDEAVSSHRLNLAIALHAAGKSDEALQEVRAGLAAGLSDAPHGAEVVRLLFVAAVLLERVDATVSLAATEAAEALLDVRRVRFGDASDLVGFDDARRHREVAATLVQRRLDHDDLLGALATADRHRARSLVEALPGQSSPLRVEGNNGSAEDLSPPPPDATIAQQVAFVTEYARAAMSRDGVPRSLDGKALVQAVADSGRTAIILHPSGEQLIIFVVRPGTPIVIAWAVAAAPVTEITSTTDQLRAQLGIVLASRAARGELPPQSIADLATALADTDDLDEGEANLDRLQRALYDALFSEVEPLLVEGEPLVVVPYRELAVIPLAVLTGQDGRALAERHPLSVLPSLASLHALAKPRLDTIKSVVVGNPSVSPQHGLGSLAGAAAEAEQLTKMLTDAGMAPTPLFRETATEAAFRTNVVGARLVHLACHAALRDPASASALFLTPAPPDDGLLLPAEVADLRLDGALVVLAACQTGLGRATADGVLGLGRAFMQAGARALVLSLWRVGDAATTHLMKELYAGLLGTAPGLDGPLDVAAALSRAQVVTRERVSSHASAWGPWLVVGDGGWRLV